MSRHVLPIFFAGTLAFVSLEAKADDSGVLASQPLPLPRLSVQAVTADDVATPEPIFDFPISRELGVDIDIPKSDESTNEQRAFSFLIA